ncbi:MAG: serine/threonine-protein phosphatase [Kiritimatiellae bacterium]|nr:serine/threonine-protein phosphatase [Kiritimatiellia bacterium]
MCFDYLDSAELSDIGQRRKRNEDSVLRVASHGVFCVADGMGGADSGDVASSATVREIKNGLTDQTEKHIIAEASEKIQIVCDSLFHANEWIKERAADRGRGMSGSTVVILIFDAFDPRKAVCLHAGDSRIYRLRGNRFDQITRDHSIAEAAGFKDKKNIPKTFRGVVTRAIGIETNLDIEQTPVDVQKADLFLLCSDGLSGMVSDRKIKRILRARRGASLSRLAADLVEEANRRGGDDNISVVLVDVGEFKSAVLDDMPGQSLDESDGDDSPHTETETETADTAIPDNVMREAAIESESKTRTCVRTTSESSSAGNILSNLFRRK